MKQPRLVSLLGGGYVCAGATESGQVRLSLSPTSTGDSHTISVMLRLAPHEAERLAQQLLDAGREVLNV